MACFTRRELFENVSQWLDGSIGNYSFNDTEVKAIAILPDRQWGYDYPPDNWVTKGLEIVIIQPVPDTVNYLWLRRQKRQQKDKICLSDLIAPPERRNHKACEGLG